MKSPQADALLPRWRELTGSASAVTAGSLVVPSDAVAASSATATAAAGPAPAGDVTDLLSHVGG